MLKKILIYAAIFVGVFLFGILLAFFGNKFLIRSHQDPSQLHRPSGRSAPASAMPAKTSTGTAAIPGSTVTGTAQNGDIVSAANPPAGPVTLGMTSATTPAPIQRATGSRQHAPYDIILLLDCSVNMKKTDPNNYRKDAARLFISLVGKDSRIGIIGFGDHAATLIPLTLNSEQNHAVLFNAVDRISSKDLTANITEAVQKGFDELKASKIGDPIIVIMSGGKLALGENTKDVAALEKLNRLLPELARAQVKLMTVAFTTESDSALLERMAKETGGFFRFARTDKDVHIMFAALYEKLHSPDTLPLDGPTFIVDPEVKEATVQVTKERGAAIELEDPAHKRHTNYSHAASMQWYESEIHDLITVKGPAPGKWTVHMNSPEGNKVYVITNVSLQTSLSQGFVNRGEVVTIDAWLEQKGGVVTDPGILENTTFTAEIIRPEGRPARLELTPVISADQSRKTAERYSATYPVSSSGEHLVKILAAGRTFKRGKTLPFMAIETTAAQDEGLKIDPAPAPMPQPVDVVFSWGRVLIQFGLVNLLLVSLGAAGYLLRRTIAARAKKS